MKDSKPVVVGIGELLWDVLPTGKRAGGAPINFVYHATQLAFLVPCTFSVFRLP